MPGFQTSISHAGHASEAGTALLPQPCPTGEQQGGCRSYQCSGEAGQSGADRARWHILAMRGDKGEALVSAADLQPMAQGSPWGPGELCPVRHGQHSQPLSIPGCVGTRETATWGSYIPTCPGVSHSTCRAWAGSGDMWDACRKWGHTQQRRWGGMSPPQGLGVLGLLRCSCRRWTPSAPVPPQTE